MNDVVCGIMLAALAADGLLAGLSLDKVIVQLPARHRIGAVAYGAYARSADLGHGIAFYAAALGPLLATFARRSGIRAVLHAATLAVAAAAVGFAVAA